VEIAVFGDEGNVKRLSEQCQAVKSGGRSDVLQINLIIIFY
jgi:hypothetical protein